MGFGAQLWGPGSDSPVTDQSWRWKVGRHGIKTITYGVCVTRLYKRINLYRCKILAMGVLSKQKSVNVRDTPQNTLTTCLYMLGVQLNFLSKYHRNMHTF